MDLVWATENAEKVTIEPLIGKVEAEGTMPVTISKTETFVLKAENPAGKVEFSSKEIMRTVGVRKCRRRSPASSRRPGRAVPSAAVAMPRGAASLPKWTGPVTRSVPR